MDLKIIESVLGAIHLPVFICKNTEGYPVQYMNVSAELLFSPSRSVNALTKICGSKDLNELMHFASPDQSTVFYRSLEAVKQLNNWPCYLTAFDGTSAGYRVSVGVVSVDRPDDGVIIILCADAGSMSGSYTSQLAEIVNSALFSDKTEESIQTMVAMAGQAIGASRAYVFEEISEAATRNTYEWCAPGVEPAIQDLQYLEKADYNYDVIIESGMYIANDTSELPANDREILEAQGIKSLAILAFYDGGKALGYVGFDDCHDARQWDRDEIHFLQSVSRVLVSLIKRRNAEYRERDANSLLQLVSDNSDEVIYVNDVDTCEVLFVNKALVDDIGGEPSDYLGKKCWEVFHAGMNGPCDFCPMPKIAIGPEEARSRVYKWEHFNDISQKTYLVKDVLVRWTNGRLVHVESASDISQQKQYEDNLRRLASIDAMTGIYNREWGGNLFREKLETGQLGHLTFIDLDGLKRTNDTHGHGVGDEMLTEIVRILRENITEADILSRWGGDEFVIWIKGGRERAEQVIEGALRDIEIFNKAKTKPFELSFSCGIVEFANDSYDTLISKADRLMYEAKMEKRGQKKSRRWNDLLMDDRLL